MNFKTVSIVKFPVDVAWKTMMNQLPFIANDVDDLDKITEVERINITDNTTKLVNIWKAKPKLPAVVMNYIKPDMLEWDDIAVWNEENKVIDWQIHSHHYHDQLHCKGQTAFEPAMGIKGCKITFSGDLEWKGKVFSVDLGVLDHTIAKATESVLAQLIPSNFRKITEALSNYIGKASPAS